jgi:hypothetical protein
MDICTTLKPPSLKRANDEYKYEFWSEIIASAIGKELGFDTLQYDIALNNAEVGCLSKSMIDANKNNLSEIINYLWGYDSNYKPEDKNSRTKYTFHFIEKALTKYKLEDKMHHIITTIIFDSLIGNGDRHQENWGFIIPNIHRTNHEKQKNNIVDSNQFRLSLSKKGVFAPIYDSGSCLGRELLDAKVEKMLNDDQMLSAYINRDSCEIRWDDGKKTSHFLLLKKIMEQPNYKKIVENEIKRVEKTFDIKRIAKIVDDIDNPLPENLNQHKLPENRKQLIKRIVSLRFDRLTEILK